MKNLLILLVLIVSISSCVEPDGINIDGKILTNLDKTKNYSVDFGWGDVYVIKEGRKTLINNDTVYVFNINTNSNLNNAVLIYEDDYYLLTPQLKVGDRYFIKKLYNIDMGGDTIKVFK